MHPCLDLSIELGGDFAASSLRITLRGFAFSQVYGQRLRSTFFISASSTPSRADPEPDPAHPCLVLSIELGGNFAASSLLITLRGFAFALVYGQHLRSTFFISASSTPPRADPELDPAHPCLVHHFVESLLQRSFESTPEVLREHVGRFFVARHRLGEAFLRLVEAGLDLELPSFVTPANALTTLPMRVNIVLAPRGSQLAVLFGVHNARSEMAARLFSGLAYARHGSQLGFSELVDTVVAYIAAAPLGVDHIALGLKVIDSALRFASRRWVLWTKSPPGTKSPPAFQLRPQLDPNSRSNSNSDPNSKPAATASSSSSSHQPSGAGVKPVVAPKSLADKWHLERPKP